MPSIQNPTYYELSQGQAPGWADEFFKRLDNDEYLEYTGTTESPTGWVGLVKVTDEMILAWARSTGPSMVIEPLRSGWYIVREDDNGLIWGIYYGSGEYTLPEEHARADYASAASVYAEWDQLNYPDPFGLD